MRISSDVFPPHHTCQTALMMDANASVSFPDDCVPSEFNLHQTLHVMPRVFQSILIHKDKRLVVGHVYLISQDSFEKLRYLLVVRCPFDTVSLLCSALFVLCLFSFGSLFVDPDLAADSSRKQTKERKLNRSIARRTQSGRYNRVCR